MKLPSLVLPLLAACASAPAPAPATPPDAPPASTPTDPATPAAPKSLGALDLPAPPWIFGQWNDLLVVAPIDPGELPAPPRVEADGSFQAFRALPPGAIAPALQAFVGQELRVLDLDAGTNACRVRIDALEAAAWIEPETDDTTGLYPETWDEQDPVFDPVAYAARLWQLGRKTIVARHTWIGDAECSRPVLAAPDAAFPAVLAAADATPAATKAVLRLVHDHALWAEQQTAYETSLALFKKHRKAIFDAGYGISDTKRFPARWDEPTPGADYQKPKVTTWSDAGGRAIFHVASVGNDIACGAPRAWFLVDAATDTILRFGIDIAPQAAVDLDRDGTWELVRTGFLTQWVERVELGSSDAPTIVAAAGDPSETELSCAWEQIPPLSVIDQVLHPKPAPPDAE